MEIGEYYKLEDLGINLDDYELKIVKKEQL